MTAEEMNNDGRLPDGTGLSSVGSSQQAVSPVPASIPDADLERLEAAARRLLKACQYADVLEDLSWPIDGEMMDQLEDALNWRFPVIWTAEQVAALNASQEGYGHPFTCGGDRGDEAHRAYADENGGDWGQLEATPRGWVCPVCDYRQTWAHPHQFMGARPSPFASFLAQGMSASGQDAERLEAEPASPVPERDAPITDHGGIHAD